MQVQDLAVAGADGGAGAGAVAGDSADVTHVQGNCLSACTKTPGLCTLVCPVLSSNLSRLTFKAAVSQF